MFHHIKNKLLQDFNSCDKSLYSIWQLWCKWGLNSSWYAWVCPPGHSPLGSSTSFVSRASGVECFPNGHMHKCSSVTFPHVTEEGVLQSTQLDSPKLALWSFTYVTLDCWIMYVSLQWMSVGHVNNNLTRDFQRDHEARCIISAMKLSNSFSLKAKSNRNAWGVLQYLRMIWAK